MSCPKCGHEAERLPAPDSRLVQPHHLGCPKKSQATGHGLRNVGHAPEDQCAKDGCTNPRAVSKGPRPAKYCTDHKTGSKS